MREVQRCVDTLVAADFVVPSWEENWQMASDPPSQDEEPSQSKHGWQRVAGHSLDDRKLQVVNPTLSVTKLCCGHKPDRWQWCPLCVSPQAG